MEKVILVNENDLELGVMEKMEAHEKGLLHRAFSIFIFNSNNEMLIQQRAMTKYHSPGLWTNACCSHPREGESVLQAGKRRLTEELGFQCSLKKSFDFIYQAKLDQGLTEHEFDHVLIGNYEGDIVFNEDEVMDYKYIGLDDLQRDIDRHPEKYTVWFKIALPELLKK